VASTHYLPNREKLSALQRPWLAVFVVFYLLLLAAATWHHTFWRDESGVWLLGRDNGLVSLMHAVRYEGHPPLWFLVVWVVAHLTLNTEWLKLPNVLATLASAAMILSVQRLSIYVRMALLCSYFLLFEYALIDRNYMLGLAFLLAAALWAQHPDTDWKVAMALSCAALTTVPSLLLAICLYGWYLLATNRAGNRNWDRKRLLALGLFLLSLIVSGLVIWPPPDSGSYLLRDQSVASLRLENAVASIAKAYVPIPGHPVAFWNITLLSLAPGYLEVLVGILLAAGLALFFRDRLQRFFFLSGSLLILLLGAYSGRNEMRHVGWLFVAFVLALMLTPASSQPFAGWRRWVLAALLAVQTGSGLYATAVSLVVPFSASKATVDYLRQQHLDQDPLVMAPGVAGLSIVAYLGHPYTFYPEFHGPGSYVIWNRSLLWNDHMPSADEMKTLGAGGKPVVLITERPLTPEESKWLGVDFLTSFHHAIAAQLPYYVYRRRP
jgi:hypothetical protein